MLTWNENENHIWYFDNDADDAFFDTVECLYVLRCSRNWLLCKISNCLSWRFEGVPGSFTLSPRVGLNLPCENLSSRCLLVFLPSTGVWTQGSPVGRQSDKRSLAEPLLQTAPATAVSKINFIPNVGIFVDEQKIGGINHQAFAIKHWSFEIIILSNNNLALKGQVVPRGECHGGH